jgi:hypothetical protein
MLRKIKISLVLEIVLPEEETVLKVRISALFVSLEEGTRVRRLIKIPLLLTLL